MARGKPLTNYPEKHCLWCNAQLHPKTYPSTPMCLSRFLATDYCDRTCAARYHAAQRTKDVGERFWSHVKRTFSTKDCWLWAAKHDKDGYGRFSTGTYRHQKWHRAHRFALELETGKPVPAGLSVLHRCDNPACCNPHHLFTGTQADNMRDCVSKGRIARGDRNGRRLHPESTLRGEAHPNAILTEKLVRKLRREYAKDKRRGKVAFLSRLYKLSYQLVHQLVCRRKTWIGIE